MSGTVTCECGRPADCEYTVWNGRDHVPVCDDCWRAPECIATEACVAFAIGGDQESLEEKVRVELGFRGMAWTVELQAFVDKCYLEWYLEPAPS